MTLTLFSLVTLISSFLSLVLSLFFFITEKGFVNENKLLGTLLVIFNLQIIFSFTVSTSDYQYFLDWHKPLYLLRQTSFLIGPLIYFYISSFLKKKNIFNAASLFHFIPFVCVLVFLMFYYPDIDHFVIWYSAFNLYDTILILAHTLIYIVLSVLSLKSMNIGFRSFVNNLKTSSPISWLQMLLLGFIIIWIVNLNSFAIVMILKQTKWCAFNASIYALTVFVFVNSIMFLLLLKPEIYYIIEKYKSNKLNEQDKHEYLKRLNAYMETEKAYLNPDITLEMLANDISVNPRILSQIINETFRKTYKAYILEFRMKESMQLLADSKYRDLTILEILYKVGFNTKSAFNAQFKQFTNLTPQEYRSKFVD